MTTYRLLRDNKETGPFSEEELIAKGFKPYDLIWVEGRSAGWRYPSEIPAFKTFAPVIEEQPYDRFYKKQPPQKLFSEEERDSRKTYTPPGIKEIPPVKQQPVAINPEPDYKAHVAQPRHIHVTLPSGNTVNLTKLVSANDNALPKEINNNISKEEIKQPAPSAKNYYADTLAVKEPEQKIVAVQYLQSNNEDERNNLALPVYNTSSPSGFSWGLIAASFIGFATLVGLGIMIGLSINKTKNEVVYNNTTPAKTQKILQPDNTSPKLSPATLQDAPATNNSEGLQVQSGAGKELVQNAVVKNTVTPEVTDQKETKKKTNETETKNNNKPLSLPDEPAVLHTKPSAPPVINVEKSLSLTPNDFKTGTFGGITGLKYTLYNGSQIQIESAEIEISYIQANNKIYKTERLVFKDIAAGAQVTLDAPPSNRGVKITSRIIKVNTKDTGLTNTTAKS